MTVQGLDHVNIRVRDVEATAAFFVDVLGMGRSEIRPTWITDADGHPVIHLGSADSTYPSDDWRPFAAADDSGSVHHVALACGDFDAMADRLSTRGVDHRVNDMRPNFDLRQIFVEAPGGVLMELNFMGS